MDSNIKNDSFVVDIDDFHIPETQSEVELNVSVENDTFEYKCIPISGEDYRMVERVDYILSGIIGMPITFLGLLINVICLFILLKSRMRKVLFNQVLTLFFLSQSII